MLCICAVKVVGHKRGVNLVIAEVPRLCFVAVPRQLKLVRRRAVAKNTILKLLSAASVVFMGVIPSASS